MKNEGKTVVVTGGAGGLGRAVIALLKTKGWTTVSLDLQSDNRADSRSAPDLALVADVSSSSEIDEAFKQIEEQFHSLDALICLAGVVFDAPVVGISKREIQPYSEEHWRQTLDVNLTGTFLSAREFLLRNIKSRRKGVIVTCSSPAAVGSPGQAAYSASKAGVEAFTVALAREASPWGIRVCGLRPALTKTPMADRYPPHILDGLVKKSLLHRFAAAEEVAQAFLFLLESDLANGRIFSLDGGIQL